MDGWDFVARYRECYGHRAPIIVLTAAQDASQRGADVSADDYLVKPFDLDTLVDHVATIADRTSLPER